MTRVLHLVMHDLRSHRALLLAWLTVVVAHPLIALLSVRGAGTSGPGAALTYTAFPLVLIASRIVLGAVAIATIVQADSPFDDRSFWRTRPISGRTMAATKLVGGAFFVIAPLLVVLMVAVVVGVPISHLPATMAQVVVTDAAAVGLALLVSARTRSVPSMLIALLATVFGLYLLLGLAAETLRVPWMRRWLTDGHAAVATAMPTLLLVSAIATWPMTALLLVAPTRRLRQLVIAGLATLVLAAVWVVPAFRLHRSVPDLARAVSLSVDTSTVYAEQVESDRVALVADGRLAGIQQGDRTRQYLLDATVDAGDGPFTARQPNGPGFLRGSDGRQPVLLGVLSRADFDRLAGRRVTLQGRARIEIARTDVLGTMPVEAGARLDAGDVRVRIREVRPAVATRLSRMVPLATADVTWTSSWTRVPRLHISQWRLRQGQDRLHVFRDVQSPFALIGLLPTLARPFGWQRSLLTVVDRPIDVASGAIEIEQTRGPIHVPQALSVEFVVPSTLQPADVTREAR